MGFKIINLSQRTDEWLKWRSQGITATDPSVIMGISKYKTPWRLWAEKTGKVLPDDLSRNPNVIRGVRCEDVIRHKREQEIDDVLLPTCVQSEDKPIFRSSLDGLDSIGLPHEFKAPAPSTFADVFARGRDSDAYKTYFPQVQEQILTLDADKGFLCFYLEPEGGQEAGWKVFEIGRDENFLKKMVSMCENFYEMVLKKKAPPKDPILDDFTPEDPEDIRKWMVAAEAWLVAQKEAKRYEKEANKQKEILTALLKNSGFVHGNAFGVKVSCSAMAGRTNWKKVLDEVNPDIPEDIIEKHTSDSSEVIRISPAKDNGKTDILETRLSTAEAHAAEAAEDEGLHSW